MQNRRKFLQAAATSGGGLALGALLPATLSAQPNMVPPAPLFDISLAQWSLNRTIRGGEMNNLDFPVLTRSEFDIGAVEYVNQFFMDKAEDSNYLAELKNRCDDNGVKSVLIMCDNEGDLGDPDPAARTQAVENHYKWASAAAYLGCHSIRVNARSAGTYGEQLDRAVDGLGRLSEFGAEHGLNVIVENHGGLSSNGKWLAAVIEQVGMENCGTLPDFGNFFISREERYDHYLGVKELMPYAKGVSAKTYSFNEQGNAVQTNYLKMMQIVLDAGYRGYVGIEWEGSQPGEIEGIKLTKALLERTRYQLSAQYD